jgi:hypothetical protein
MIAYTLNPDIKFEHFSINENEYTQEMPRPVFPNLFDAADPL